MIQLMKSNAYNRREFLGRTFVSSAVVAMSPASLSWAAEGTGRKKAGLGTPKAEKLGWKVCCQLYTFRDRGFYEALEVIAGLGIQRVEPGFFLPLSKDEPGLTTSENLAPAKRREMKA